MKLFAAANRRSARKALAGLTAILAVAAGSIVLSAGPAQADVVRDSEYWLADYGIESAWNVTRGAGVKVAVIDTGVDGSVEDLRGAVVGGTDASLTGSPNGQTPVGDDDNEHGTMVASLIAGRGTGPGSGVLGVAPEASILSVSVSFGGDTPVSNDDQIAQAVRWAVDNGAGVINMSLTRNSLEWPESWDDAFSYAFAHDVVIVAAAGNRGAGTTEVGAPATIPGVVAVAGVDEDREASFDASSQGITLAVSAPSERLVGVVPGGGYVRWAGTSGATPIVAGVVALIRAAHPELDANNVINRLISTTQAPPDGGNVALYGYGLIDASAAVSNDVPSVIANPLGDLAEWIRIYRRSADAPAAPTATGSIEMPQAAPRGSESALPEWFREAIPPFSILTAVVLPLGVLTIFGALFVLASIGALRHFAKLRRQNF